MKTLYLHSWVLLNWLLGQAGNGLNALIGFFDWTQIGWAFAGSTSYILYEVTKNPPIHRSGWQRFYCIVIGFFFALALNKVFNLFKPSWPLDSVTYLTAALGYKMFSALQRQKASDIAKKIDNNVEEKDNG